MTDVKTKTPLRDKLQEQAHPLVAFREQLVKREPELKNALPPQISPQHFTRVALTAIQLNQELLICDRQSLWNALMRCAADGLLPDGRQAAIVPFNDSKKRRVVAVYMPMIAGLLQRFRNSGQFKSVGAGVVNEGDQFEYWIDEHGEHLKHVPGDGTGKPIKAYARAETKDGGIMIKVMSHADVERRRAVSRAKDGPMWKEWWSEAAQKTVLRNLMKLLPSSSDDIDRLLGADDDEPISNAPSLAPANEPRPALSITSALDRFGGDEPPPQGPPTPYGEQITGYAQHLAAAAKDGPLALTAAWNAVPDEFKEQLTDTYADLNEVAGAEK